MATTHENQKAGVEVSIVLLRKGAISRINEVGCSGQKKKKSDYSVQLLSIHAELGY